MSRDHYNTLETKVKEHIKHNTSDFCLLYDLAAVHYRYHKQAQSVPKIGEFQLSSVTDLEVTNWNEIASISPFWPDMRNDVLQQLRQNVGWIIFYPMTTKEWESTRHSCPATSKEKIQNLHNGLEVALLSFKAACDKMVWKVKMKFAIAYGIGNTELHDKLCGKYDSFNKGVMRMCRHCNCYSPNINIPSVQPATRKWSPANFHCFPGTDLNDINKSLKNNSHHNIRNVFHDLCFGTNQNNIHFATPGECLHMHQLGTTKWAVESIELLLCRSVPCVYAPNLKHGGAVANSIGYLAQRYGGLLSCQSDRDFPRTKFGTQLLSTTKKEGHDFSGIFSSLWFLNTDLTLLNLPKTIVHFINCINSTCHRKRDGNKTNQESPVLLSPTRYISSWGSPAGWDSAPNESHHKTEIKAPSKNTQGNAASLINQTAQRKSEKMMLSQATYHYNLNPPDPPPIERPDGGGSHFQIMRTKNGESTMNKNATTPPSYKSLYKNACTLKDDIQLEPFEMALNDNKSSDYLSSSDSNSYDSLD
eukprot:jgi/Psemu1/36773/gm1.36773_g